MELNPEQVVPETPESPEQEVPEVAEQQATPEQPPVRKLFDVLVEQELYTKSFDEFKQKYSTPQEIEKLHSFISAPDYELYTKSLADFENQYFPELKKKDVSPSGTTEPSATSGAAQAGESLPTTAQTTTSSKDGGPQVPESAPQKEIDLSKYELELRDRGYTEDDINKIRKDFNSLPEGWNKFISKDLVDRALIDRERDPSAYDKQLKEYSIQVNLAKKGEEPRAKFAEAYFNRPATRVFISQDPRIPMVEDPTEDDNIIQFENSFSSAASAITENLEGDDKYKTLDDLRQLRSRDIDAMLNNKMAVKNALRHKLLGKPLEKRMSDYDKSMAAALGRPTGEVYKGKDVDAYEMATIESSLDPNDEIAQEALRKYKIYNGLDKISDEETRLDDKAIEFMADVNGVGPMYQASKENGLEFPNVMKGELMYQFLNDPIVQEQAELNPKFKALYDRAYNGLSINYPEFAEKQVATTISQAMEDMGYNNPIANAPTQAEVDAVVNKLMAEGKMNELQKEIYEQKIKPTVGVAQSILRGTVGVVFPQVPESKIVTQDLLSGLKTGFQSGVKGMARGLEFFAGLPLDVATEVVGNEKVNSMKRRAQIGQALDDMLTSSSVATIDANAINEGFNAVGNFTSFVIPLMVGGAVLEGAGLTANAAHTLSSALTFSGINNERAMQEFPDDFAKRNLFVAASTAIDMSISKLLPIDKVKKGVSSMMGNDIKSVVNDLTSGKITSDIAKKRFGNIFLEYGKNLGVQNLETATVLTGLGEYKKMNDAIFGVKNAEGISDAVELFKEFKSSFLSGTILSAVGAYGKTKASNKLIANNLLEMSYTPNTYRKLIEEQMALNPEKRLELQEQLDNLDILVSVRQGVEETDMTQAQKEKYILNGTQAKVFENMALKSTDQNVAAEYMRKAESLKSENEKIFKGEDKAEEYALFEEAPKPENKDYTKIEEIKEVVDNLKAEIEAGGEAAGQAQFELEMITKDPVSFYTKQKEEFLRSTEGTEVTPEEREATSKAYDELIDKIKKYDSEVQAGISGEVRVGEEPVETKSVEGAGKEEAGAGGVLQAPEPGRESEAAGKGESVEPAKETPVESGGAGVGGEVDKALEERQWLLDKQRATGQLPSEWYFLNNPVGDRPFMGKKFEKTLTEKIEIADIIPTQKEISSTKARNIKEVSKQNPQLIKVGEKYYVFDGHHRIANDILNKNTSIDADVFDYDKAKADGTNSELVKAVEQSLKEQPKVEAEKKKETTGEAKPSVKGTTKIEEVPLGDVVRTPEEGSTVRIEPQIKNGLQRNMIFTEGEWKQQVGGIVTRVAESTQKRAQEQFNKRGGPKTVPSDAVNISVAPYYDTKIEKVEDAQPLRESEGYKTHLNKINSIAKEMGLEIEKIDETIGGFTNEFGNEITEISNRVVLKTNDLKAAEEFAAAIGALTHQTQEATIAARYVEHGSPKAVALEIEMKVDNIPGTLEALKEAGIADFEINESTNTVKILDFKNGADEKFNDRMFNFAENLDTKKVNYATEYHAIESTYIDPATSAEILREAESKTQQQQGRPELYNLFKSAREKREQFIADKEAQKQKIGTIAKDLLSELGISEGEIDIKFSKKLDTDEPLTPKENKEKELVDQMNNMSLVNKGIDLSSNSTTKEKIDVNELNSRLDNPLSTVKWEEYEGIPFTFTISDQLRTGDVKNPNTGEVISDLKGGIGFNGTKGNENNAWANTSKEEASAMMQRASDVYNNNKALFEKLWKDGKLPDGHIPMAVVKMAETSILSNEAVFRAGIQNIETLPKLNRKKAVSELIKSMKAKIATETSSLNRGVDKNGAPYTENTIKQKKKSITQYKKILDVIKNYNYDDIANVLKDKDHFSLPEKSIIANEVFYGNPTPIGGKAIDISRSRPSTPVSKALIGNKNPALINLGKITDLLTEPSMKDVPNMHIISIVGVDVKNPKLNKIDHPNYPYGVKGKSIGVLESPIHMKDAFGEAYGSVLSQIAKNEAGKASISIKSALTQGIPVQSGLPNRVFKSAIAKGNLDAIDKLSGFLRQAFPNTTFFTSQEAWDAAMADPSIKKKLKDGDVVYAFTADGNVFLNPRLKTTKATLHETGHIWTSFVKENNPDLHKKGLDLVSGTKEHKKAIEEYGDTELAREEALMELMSTKGDTILNAAQKAQFKEWLITVYKYVAENFKSLLNLTPKQIENLTLDKFIEGMLSDILSGKEISSQKVKSEAKFSLESRESKIREYIDNKRKSGESDSNIRTAIELIADKIGLSKSDIDSLMEVKEPIKEAEIKNPFESVPKTAAARDKYFEQNFGEEAEYAKSIYNKYKESGDFEMMQKEFETKGAGVPPTVNKDGNIEGTPEAITGITMAANAERRKALGMPERQANPQSFEQWDAEAKKMLSEGYDINALIERMNKGIASTPVENSIKKIYVETLQKQIEANPTNELLAKYKKFIEATEVASSEAGRNLVSLRGNAEPLETLADFYVAKMEANGVSELTEAQKKQVEDAYRLVEQTRIEYQRKLDKANEESAKLQAQAELTSLSKEEKAKKIYTSEGKRDYRAERENLKAKLKELYQGYVNSMNKIGLTSDGGAEGFVISAKMAKAVMDIAKSHVEEIGSNLNEVVKKTLDDVKDIFNGITEKDIINVIAGVYNEKKMTQNELTASVKELKTEAKLLNELERVMSGVPKEEKERVEKNRKLEEIRQKIKDLKKQQSLDEYSDEAKVKKAIAQNEKRQQELEQKIANKDFEQKEKPVSIYDDAEFKKNNPELYEELLESYRKKQDAQNEFEIEMLKDEQSKRPLYKKAFDLIEAAVNTTKKVVTGIDDSALFMQTLYNMVVRPVIAGKAFSAHIRDMVSKRAFEKSLDELHNSKWWDIIQKSGLSVSEPQSLLEAKREEIFSGQTLDVKFKIKGKEYGIVKELTAPFERAFTSLGNNMRVISFMTIAEKYFQEGHTFENNPKLFKDLAKMLNTETGRGDINEHAQKINSVLTKGIWSPKLMASRLNILGISDFIGLFTGYKFGTKGYYKELDPKIRRQAAIDLSKFIAAVSAITYGFAYSFGGEVDDDPTSQTFMDVKVGDKSYNFAGGFAQYIRLVAQNLAGGQTRDGKFKSLAEKGKDAGSNTLHFLRGKLTPVSGVVVDVFSGMKDFNGQPVTVKDEIQRLTIPMSMQGVSDALTRDGYAGLLTSTLPSFVGINVKDQRDFAGKQAFTPEEQKSTVFKKLKEFGIDVPTFGDRTKYKIAVDKKHKEEGKEKDGTPYALLTEEEYNTFKQYKKDFIIKSLELLFRENDAKAIKLTQQNLSEALDDIKAKSTKIAKGKLIEKGVLPEPDEEMEDEDEAIKEIINDYFYDVNPQN